MRRLLGIISILICCAACDSLWKPWTVRNQLPCEDPNTLICSESGDGGTPGDGFEPTPDQAPLIPLPRCSSDGWCSEYPQPQGATLRAVWRQPAGDTWAVGAYGIIQRRSGAIWSLERSGTLETLRGIWGNSASNIWVVGTAGTILHYDGQNWSLVPSGTTATLSAVWGLNANRIWAVGAGGVILYYDGQGWSSQMSSVSVDLTGVAGVGAGQVYAVGGANLTGVVVRWNGSSWAMEALPAGTGILSAIQAVDSTHVWAVGEDSAIVSWDGSAWSLTRPGAADLLGVWAANATNVWVVGLAGQTYYYNGTAWSSFLVPFPFPLHAVSGQDPGNRIAVGAEGTIYVGSFTGAAWQLENDTVGNFEGVWGTSADNLWAIGTSEGSSQIARRVADSWNNGATMMLGGLAAIHGTATNDIWVVGGSDKILHYNGSNWTPVASGSIAINFTGVWAVSRNLAFATGDGRYMYRWDGAAWSKLPHDFNGTMQAVWAADANNIVAVGHTGYVFMSTNSGNTWQQMVSGIASTDILYAVYGTSWNDIWAVSGKGQATRFDGSVWRPRATCTTSPLYGVFGSAPGKYVAVGQFGAVCAYDGQNWVAEKVKTTATLTAVFGPDPNNTWIVGTSNHVLGRLK